jgi:hypothetical protein
MLMYFLKLFPNETEEDFVKLCGSLSRSLCLTSELYSQNAKQLFVMNFWQR